MQTFSQSAIASITSSVKSFGCGDTNLILSIPSILFIAFSSVANEFIPSYSFPSSFHFSALKYEFTFCPNSVISLYPSFASSFTSANMSFGCLLLSLPRTYGTIQYVQKLLHPYIIVTDAFILLVLFIGSPSYTSPSISNMSCCFFLVSNVLYKSSGKFCNVCVPNIMSVYE